MATGLLEYPTVSLGYAGKASGRQEKPCSISYLEEF
jgi:hypothetical protein